MFVDHRKKDISRDEKPWWLDNILKGSCLASLEAIPDKCVDLVFADPPYNLQLSSELRRPDNSKVDAVDNDWDRFDSFQAYDAFTQAWLLAVRRILKSTGMIWVMGSYHNIFRVGCKMQDAGFWILNDIIWRKTNPMPNFRGRRFQNAHETLIWAVRDRTQKNYRFNYHAMKAANDDLQMRSDWLFPVCAGAERLKDENGKKLHPTQKPEALIRRILLSSTLPGDVVLDPFFGSGTTGVVARQLGRHFVGCEQEETYIEAARKRIDGVIAFPSESLYVTGGDKGKEPRIAFVSLVENGLITPGTVLYDQEKRWAAIVRADGTLSIGQTAGSIHRIGAYVQGTTSCNGWTFWHYESASGLTCINELRSIVRAGMAKIAG